MSRNHEHDPFVSQLPDPVSCHLYQHDVRYRHLQAWPATRDWLRKNVSPSLDVPDSVDFDAF